MQAHSLVQAMAAALAVDPACVNMLSCTLAGLPPSPMYSTHAAACCREEGKCSLCGSFNRMRQVAEAALPEVQRISGRRFSSLREVVQSDLAIYNTQCAGVFHKLLHEAPGYVCRCALLAQHVDRRMRHPGQPGSVRT